MMPTPANEVLKSASLPLPDAIKRAKEYVNQMIKNRPVDWAIEASTRLNEEMSQLETYYKSLVHDADKEEREILLTDLNRKKSDLQSLHAPKITIEIKQMALIGLHMKQ